MSRVKRLSSLYESSAWPDPTDPAFVNVAAEIETSLSPEALMAALHAIEAAFGRRRSKRNAPRTLDLDLIAYHNEVRTGENADLILPHPRLSGRAFVLAPLAEIAPAWRNPVTGESVSDLAAKADMATVRKIS
jgi:2-amino-4-hydroxy-6-hydroxymethyldihydropteridine diphosphokinase